MQQNDDIGLVRPERRTNLVMLFCRISEACFLAKIP